MGVLDSSFLVLPFGNDLVVVGMVARHHHGAAIYVVMAAVGSTIGASLVAFAGHKMGEAGISKLAGPKRFANLKKHICSRGALVVAAGALAPPPFPYTLVIAAASAFQYPVWRILLVNFIARGVRFTILALLAIKFGHYVLEVAASAPFRWTMVGFIILCLAGSVYSVWTWLHHARPGKA